MQLFELVSPKLFRPLAGPNRAYYAELLLLLWEECRHTADYSLSRAEAVSRAEDYFAAVAKPLALDADGAGDEDEQPTRDPHLLALGFLLRLRRTGWLEEQPGSYEEEPTLAFVPEVTPLLEALEEIRAIKKNQLEMLEKISGYTVDEALNEVDKFLDSGMLRGQSTLYIIHGNGTGALRTAIQKHLRTHKAVKSFRLGRYGEGESGVTVVELK